VFVFSFFFAEEPNVSLSSSMVDRLGFINVFSTTFINDEECIRFFGIIPQIIHKQQFPRYSKDFYFHKINQQELKLKVLKSSVMRT